MSDPMKFFTDGEQYERLMGRWSRLVGDKFIDWLALPTSLRWLDVGCGNGAFTEMVVTRCAPSEVHGIDPSEAQIAYAGTRDVGKRVQFRAGEAGALPYDDDNFDVATMALVISFVPDAAKSVAEMTRVVRPGGWVATYMWDIPGGGLPVAPLRKAIQELELGSAALPPGFDVSRLSSLLALWQEAGLEAVEGRRIDIEVNYADLDDFWLSNTGLGSPTSQIIRTLASYDTDRLRDWLHKSLPQDAAGHIRYSAHANAVKGRVPQ